MANEVITVPFGVGELYLTDNASPAQAFYVGGLQELTLKISKTTKGFKGAYIFDLLKAITGAEATLSAKYGGFKADLMASVLGGVTTTGHRRLIQSESTGTISGATYTVVNTTGYQDKGVCDENGVPLKRTSGAPGTTEYSVTTGGVFTFNAAANGKVYTVRYTYSVAGSGKNVAISNSLMAAPSTFYQVDAFNPTENMGFVMSKAVAKSLDFPRKNDDFTVQGIEFDLYPDANGLLGTVYFGS